MHLFISIVREEILGSAIRDPAYKKILYFLRFFWAVVGPRRTAIHGLTRNHAGVQTGDIDFE